MQLSPRRPAPAGRLPALALVAALATALAVLFLSRPSAAQVAQFDTTHTVFLEAPTKSKMTVYSPATDLEVTPWDFLSVRGGWEADVVSGASVKVKAGPAYAATHPGADVVTAASVHDFRNSAHGGFTLRKDTVQFTGGYVYSTENDYKSNAFNVAARTDAYEHNTQFEIAYAHNFDRVCDRVQSVNDPAPRWRGLEDSTGCFASSSPLRVALPISIDNFQASWSQAWTPVIQTQLTYTAQVTNGFQSNPYRSVILGEGVVAQEHEPENRARQSVSLRANFYIRPLRAALRLGLRGYRDTWTLQSGTGEAEFEKYFGEPFRVTLRGRYYKQTGAVFWSDDYTGGVPPLGPKGQYWTGDRELSPMSSWLVGLRAIYTATPSHGRLLGIMTSFKFGLFGEVVNFSYDEFTLAGQPVENARAWVFGLTLSAVF